uniref:CCHC-type domain-containing protein n=1 Tax=Heterorhabditis bacteriophora TaxID=37862 RepID=A0A1I7X2E3_HETBA
MRSSGVCFCQLLVLTEADVTSVRSTTPLFSNELQFRTTFTLNNDEAISVYDFLGDKYKVAVPLRVKWGISLLGSYIRRVETYYGVPRLIAYLLFLTIIKQSISCSRVTTTGDQQSDNYTITVVTTQKFIFEPDQGETFDIWYKRFKDVFMEDGATLDDKQKTRLLVSRLDSATHARFTGHILPKTPIVYQNEDFDSFANIVNQRCEEAEFKNIDIDGIKCLLFVAGFQAAEFADYRTRLLRTLDQANKLSLKDLEDAMTLEQASYSVRTVKKPFKKNQQHTTISKSPPYPCPDCGGDHYRNKCPSRHTEET